ncbi:chorion protein S15-like [Calliphora vicina]|uniref:chorion protein S15-like n=1 Tax=Calliphora vicina TaxID=7373 RepID=UPI00325A6FFE
MNKSIIFAVITFAAVVCIYAKPGYFGQSYNAPSYLYSSPVYAKPAVAYNAPSASAAAAAASSVASPGYLYHVPSYVIDGGNSGYAIYNPGYINGYNAVY